MQRGASALTLVLTVLLSVAHAQRHAYAPHSSYGYGPHGYGAHGYSYGTHGYGYYTSNATSPRTKLSCAVHSEVTNLLFNDAHLHSTANGYPDGWTGATLQLTLTASLNLRAPWTLSFYNPLYDSVETVGHIDTGHFTASPGRATIDGTVNLWAARPHTVHPLFTLSTKAAVRERTADVATLAKALVPTLAVLNGVQCEVDT